MARSRTSLYLALFVAFIDLMGIGLIYPLFSSMLFECKDCLVSPEATKAMRGVILGLLLSLMPFVQFFSAPLWGTFSDNKGRKKPLLYSLTIGCFGYAIAVLGIPLNSLTLLFISRAVIGFAAGNMAVVQATIADVSSTQNKAKNFGLYSMAQGIGFTFGPFIGGTFSRWSYTVPFFFAALLTLLNLAFVFLFFQETNPHPQEQKFSWTIGIEHLRNAFRLKGVRIILFCSFLNNFAWSYFFEFAPVYLIYHYRFTSTEIGYFYAVAGGLYALSTGLLIRPFLNRFKPETLFFIGNLSTAIVILAIPFIPSVIWLWLLLAFLCFFGGFVVPTATALISNNAPRQVQGEALGVLGSVNAAAFVFSPLFSGSLVGDHPKTPMWVGGVTMLITALIVLAAFGRELFDRKATLKDVE